MRLDIINKLKKYKKEIDWHLENFFIEKVKESGKLSPDLQRIIKEAKKFTLQGGKRLRPVIFLYGYKCFQEGNDQAVLGASIAIELMQSYFLVHDDIIDEDKKRRGKPALHIVYENQLKRGYGSKMAILAGDILENYALEVLAESSFEKKCLNQATRQYCQVAKNVNYGQILDLLSENNFKIKETEILKIYRQKTASYTTTGPLLIGAMLAGADEKSLIKLKQLGDNLGLAFQLQDDWLGLFGSLAKVGKPLGSDIKEGKMTILMAQALKKSVKSDRKFIQHCLGNRKITIHDIARVKKIVSQSGAQDYCQKLIRRYIGKANQLLKQTDFRPEAKEFLGQLANYIGERDY